MAVFDTYEEYNSMYQPNSYYSDMPVYTQQSLPSSNMTYPSYAYPSSLCGETVQKTELPYSDYDSAWNNPYTSHSPSPSECYPTILSPPTYPKMGSPPIKEEHNCSPVHVTDLDICTYTQYST